MSDSRYMFYQLDEQLCFAVYTLNLAIQRFYKPMLDDLGITYPQYLVLCSLWESDGVTVGYLANALGLDPSTLSPMLKRLQRSGHILKFRNPQSDREVLVYLTEAGKTLEKSARRLNIALGNLCGERTATASLTRSIQDLAARVERASEGTAA